MRRKKMKLNSILVPTDGSDNAYKAMDLAVDLAKHSGANITSIFVVDRKPGFSAPDLAQCEIVTEAAKKEAETALIIMKSKADEAGIAYTEKVLTGDPADAILKESENHDMIVMTSVGRSGLAKAFMGSVSQTVVAHAACPVLVIKPGKR